MVTKATECLDVYLRRHLVGRQERPGIDGSRDHTMQVTSNKTSPFPCSLISSIPNGEAGLSVGWRSPVSTDGISPGGSKPAKKVPTKRSRALSDDETLLKESAKCKAQALCRTSVKSSEFQISRLPRCVVFPPRTKYIGIRSSKALAFSPPWGYRN